MFTHMDLASKMERFVEEHPNGWDHDAWTGFLRDLADAGHDVWDRDGIGLGLEHVRLVQILNRMEIKGLGPKRTENIANHFGTLWNLMAASAEEVARATGIPPALAAQISDVLQ